MNEKEHAGISIHGTSHDCIGLLTYDEAADKLRITTRYLRTLVARGELESVPIGRRRLFTPASIDAYINGRLEAQRNAA